MSDQPEQPVLTGQVPVPESDVSRNACRHCGVKITRESTRWVHDGGDWRCHSLPYLAGPANPADWRENPL